jgi:serine acetyltransferase
MTRKHAVLRTLYLCGAGNPSGVRLALTINREHGRWERVVLLDDDPSKHGQSILEVGIMGPFAYLQQADPESDEVVNLIARTTLRRWNARRKIREYAIPFATLVDPTVDLSGVRLARDVTIYPNAVVGPETVLDESVVVFMGAAIGPWCRLRECSVIGPNAVANARVDIGAGTYVGTSASIVPEAKIGTWATIGSSSAVMSAVPDGATVIGVPAKILPTPAVERPADWEDEKPVQAAEPASTPIGAENRR